MQVNTRLCNAFVGDTGSGKSVAMIHTLAAEAKQDRFNHMHFFIYSEESDVEAMMNTINLHGVTREFIVCPTPEVLLEELTKLRENIARSLDAVVASGNYVPEITLFIDAVSQTRFSRERGFPGRGRSVEFTDPNLRKAVALVERFHVTMSLSRT